MEYGSNEGNHCIPSASATSEIIRCSFPNVRRVYLHCFSPISAKFTYSNDTDLSATLTAIKQQFCTNSSNVLYPFAGF